MSKMVKHYLLIVLIAMAIFVPIINKMLGLTLNINIGNFKIYTDVFIFIAGTITGFLRFLHFLNSDFN